jgi:hypothetical protein
MDLTVGKLVSWLFGLGLILFGLIGFLFSVVGGLILLLVGVFLLPPVRTKLADEQNITFSRWLVVVIFLVGSIAGLYVVGINDPSDNGANTANPNQNAGGQSTPDVAQSTPTPESNLIEKPPEQMLPIIDDFESGWRQSEQEDSPANQTTLYNVETNTFVVFDVMVFDSVEGASNEYDQRQASVREEGMSSESMSVGDQGFMYKFSDTYIFVNFRVGNVVGRVEFDGPETLTPETNAVDFARLLQDTITR